MYVVLLSLLIYYASPISHQSLRFRFSTYATPVCILSVLYTQQNRSYIIIIFLFPFLSVCFSTSRPYYTIQCYTGIRAAIVHLVVLPDRRLFEDCFLHTRRLGGNVFAPPILGRGINRTGPR